MRTSCYTDEELLQHAKQFKTRKDWEAFGNQEVVQGVPSHHRVAFKRGGDFYRKCCAHMPDERGGSRGYKYSDDDLVASARRYQTRNEWKKGDYNKYQVALLRPIKDECFAHMRPAANPYAADYIIYVYEFSDGWAYVGLTVVESNRKTAHLFRGPVFEHVKVCPSPVYKTLETNLSFTAVVLAEAKWQADYVAAGWKPLWKAKAGSLGGIHGSKWTKAAVLAEAKKYATKQEWIDGSQPSYRIAKREGWFEEASAHMPKRVLGIGAGMPKSPEAREKMSQAKLGKKHTAAQRAARKEYWLTRRAQVA